MEVMCVCLFSFFARIRVRASELKNELNVAFFLYMNEWFLVNRKSFKFSYPNQTLKAIIRAVCHFI